MLTDRELQAVLEWADLEQILVRCPAAPQIG